jgi:outer membrane PBP1 activator LpoA protein
MFLKQSVLVSMLLLLSGCSVMEPKPQEEEQVEVPVPVTEQEQTQTQEQTLDQEQLQSQAQGQETGLTPARMLVALERFATLKTANTRQRVERLQTGTTDLTAEDRFELVLLLSQKNAKHKSLNQALRLLDSLESEASEPSVKEILRLQRHNLQLRKLYRSARRKSDKLQKKIEYLKGLERELEESNTRYVEPPPAKPESSQ